MLGIIRIHIGGETLHFNKTPGTQELKDASGNKVVLFLMDDYTLKVRSMMWLPFRTNIKGDIGDIDITMRKDIIYEEKERLTKVIKEKFKRRSLWK